MAVCAIVSAVLADRSLRASSSAPAGVVKAQARPSPASRYNTTDMIESSRACSRRRTAAAAGRPGSLAGFSGLVRPSRRRDRFIFAAGMWYLRAGRTVWHRDEGDPHDPHAHGRSAKPHGDIIVIGVGVVGCNYGKGVLIPAFRNDPRCEVVALAVIDAAGTTELARAANVARGFGDWRALVEDPAVDAGAVPLPPDLQPQGACRALHLRQPA